MKRKKRFFKKFIKIKKVTKKKEKKIDYDYKNIFPFYENLLDKFGIVQYKNIQIPRLFFFNSLFSYFEKYKKPFNEIYEKINFEYLYVKYFSSKFWLFSENNNEIKKTNKNKKTTGLDINQLNKENIFLNDIENNDEQNFALNDHSTFSFIKFQNNIPFMTDLNEENSLNKKSQKKIFKLKLYDKNNNLIHKKRGRRTEIVKLHPHSAFDDDNILRKIQVHFLTFLVSFTNDYLDALSSNWKKKNIYNFKQLDYQLKKTINHQYIEQMKIMTIGDILQMQASPKNRSCPKNINEIIYKKICEQYPELKLYYFNKLFKEFFVEYYYNKNERFVIINRVKVILSNKTKTFIQLIQKNIKFKEKFKIVASYFYMNNQKEKKYEISEKNVNEQTNIKQKPIFIID